MKVVAALLTASMIWLATNVVLSSDLERIQHEFEEVIADEIESVTKQVEVVAREVESVQTLVLRRELRELSREIRLLDEQASMTRAERNYRVELIEDLSAAEKQINQSMGDD